MSLIDYIRLLRRGWLVIVLTAALGTLAAVALTAATAPTFNTAATVYVSVSGDESPTDLSTGGSFATQRATTYADLARTSTVLDRAAAALGATTTAEDLRTSVSATARQGTSLIDIGASGSDAQQAADQANAVAAALASAAPLLDAPGLATAVRLTVVQSAAVPTAAIAPKPVNNILIGLAVGLVLGLAIIVVGDALSTRIRSSADLPHTAALATLTSMPSGPSRRSRHLSVTDTRLEAFRQLRANLQFGSNVGQLIAVAGVSSASDAHGAARQLAAAFSETGSSVVVANLDLRPEEGTRARRRRREGPIVQSAGVADVLSGAGLLDDVVNPSANERVYEVQAGQVDSSSAQRMSTPAMQTMLDTLSSRFDYVVLACPPLIERSEAAVAAALAGSALVVVESGVTTRADYAFAMELLAGVRVASISVAVDHVRDVGLGGGRGAKSLTASSNETP